jgi:hypothetical protein
MARYIAENSVNAYILYRELDFFEQLGALVEHGGFDFELIRTMLGHRLTDRWEMWRPSKQTLAAPRVAGWPCVRARCRVALPIASAAW